MTPTDGSGIDTPLQVPKDPGVHHFPVRICTTGRYSHISIFLEDSRVFFTAAQDWRLEGLPPPVQAIGPWSHRHLPMAPH